MKIMIRDHVHQKEREVVLNDFESLYLEAADGIHEVREVELLDHTKALELCDHQPSARGIYATQGVCANVIRILKLKIGS